VALGGPAPASADMFGPISLASESAVQQADYARDPAISGNGRYVAFDGSFGGQTGVWRRDLQTGVVEQVAGGDAELPSISQNGQYVSFTTTARLSPHDHNEGPDVYVASLRPGAPGPEYELASATDGSEEGLDYEGVSEPTRYGSLTGGRYALSADGRKVAFVTTAVSNLAGPGTPALQVALRDLDTHTTQLVSVAYPPTASPQPVATIQGSSTYGAAYAEGGQIPPFNATEAYASPRSVGASISADGSTVAWIGQDVGKQVQLLPGESLVAKYAEPLWRRIADGPLAPTRRITGGSDPANPACAASGELSIAQEASLADPCQGPFATYAEPSSPGTGVGHVGDFIPCLSADGYTVAFLATAPLVSSGSNFGITENPSNLYVANMHPGLTRDQALRPLTEPASGISTDLATNAAVVDLGISADATKIAFTTMRTVFPLGTPAYVSAPAAVPGMVELFDVDLADETLTRVTRGYEGGGGEHPHEPAATGEDAYFNLSPADGALSPSYSSDGNTLEFSSTASNLVYGDGNTPPASVTPSRVFDGSDAFGVSRVLFGSEPAESYVSSAPPAPAIVPNWRLDATAFSHKDGSVVLDVEVPGAGLLRTTARGAVPVRAPVSLRARRRSRGGRLAATVATRAVATRVAHPGGDGMVTLTLKPVGRYAALAGAPGGLSATVSLLFTAPGRPALRESLAVRFLRAPHSRARRSHRGLAGARRRGHGGGRG
jgi:hypothetical protein